MTQPAHVSVLLKEVIEALEPAPGKTIVDATFGAGGYSRALLDAGAEVIAFDRDPGAAAFAEPLIATGRFRLVADRFSTLAEHVDTCDGVAFDLGVSSMQLDEADRGFSFMRDGPLDMRMSRAGISAADLVNSSEQAELARIFWVYGEERQSRRIAAALVRRRGEAPFDRTLDLADTVERALGGRRGAKTHPATRVFQALRIAVNAELTELEEGLDAAERGPPVRRDALACVSMPTCPLAMAEAERYLPQLLGRVETLLESHGVVDVPLSLRITGCPNGCARPYLAEIGLIGKAPGRYNLHLGGDARGERLNVLYRENLDEAAILAELDPLFAGFAADRLPDERFGDFLWRTGLPAA